MADLGAVAKDFVEASKSGIYSMPFPNYAVTEIRDRLNQDASLGGTVYENGVPLKDCEVVVFWRPTMARIARAFTDANGDWLVSGLDPAKTDHYAVVIKDKAGGTVYNDGYYALPDPV